MQQATILIRKCLTAFYQVHIILFTVLTSIQIEWTHLYKVNTSDTYSTKAKILLITYPELSTVSSSSLMQKHYYRLILIILVQG